MSKLVTDKAAGESLLPRLWTGRDDFILVTTKSSFHILYTDLAFAVKRHHNHSNSYKGKHLLAWLTYSPLWQGAWQHAGRHGTRAESASSCRQQEVD